MCEKTIQQVQEENTDVWMAIPGVVGTAIGTHKDKPCIVILTAVETERISRQIPSAIEGYPVVIRYTGQIRALDEP
jgi:hypothetical protein